MPHPSVHFLASLEETTNYLLKHLRNKDVLLVLSAGDADQISANVLAPAFKDLEVSHGR